MARRIAARHDALAVRWPRVTRTLDTLIRGVLMQAVRRELPRIPGLLELAIAAMPGAWPHEGIRECRGLWHGYRLRLDVSDYYQRLSYLMGRYHEIGLQLLMRRALRPGDVVIDGGANNGIAALVAAWCVSPGGRVLAFEPNPRVYEQLRWHVEQNALAQVSALPFGLSDQDQQLELRVPGADNLGAGTFSPLPNRYGGQVQQKCLTAVRRGDGIAEIAALGEASGEMMVKLDMEGFELRALRGLSELIAKRRPLVVCEVNPEMLTMAGTSPREVMEFMAIRGYRAFAFTARRATVRMRRLELREIAAASGEIPFDVAWVHPDSGMWARVSTWMQHGER